MPQHSSLGNRARHHHTHTYTHTHTHTINERQNPEINPNIYSELIFNKGAKNMYYGKDNLFKNSAVKTGYSYAE